MDDFYKFNLMMGGGKYNDEVRPIPCSDESPPGIGLASRFSLPGLWLSQSR
jgi:hypothetical protein